jgi:hypothetical protein
MMIKTQLLLSDFDKEISSTAQSISLKKYTPFFEIVKLKSLLKHFKA